jgi:hypothetical protein
MRDPHRRVGLVDVLAPGAARAVRVDAEVALVDVDALVFRRSGLTITCAKDVWRRCA